ncbi:hypothetical protein RBE51_19115 [Pseudomonas taiwanensis]|uniref:hypothetical protein n=1 Tax=Pseudomonas taiwanensis TaxID=470150 RepID=UPI0028DEB90C|nr:hypothetical protein [Pseudomonas taiwanensis]MDT8924901.1 hypothetical protein [Pseudomonas taiwanensis]
MGTGIIVGDPKRFATDLVIANQDDAVAHPTLENLFRIPFVLGLELDGRVDFQRIHRSAQRVGSTIVSAEHEHDQTEEDHEVGGGPITYPGRDERRAAKEGRNCTTCNGEEVLDPITERAHLAM